MPPAALPRIVKPAALAREAPGRLAGRLTVDRLPRLREAAPRTVEAVSFDLEFRAESDGTVRVDGRVRAVLELVCQRCLEPVSLELAPEVHLQVVATERDAVDVAAPYEPLLATDGEVALAGLVEDEVMLTVPAAPVHPPGQGCEVPPRYRAGADAARETRRPLGGLAALKGEPSANETRSESQAGDGRRDDGTKEI